MSLNNNEKLCDDVTCNHFLCEECVGGMCTTACPMCRHSPIQNSFITKEVLKNIEEKYKKQKAEIASDFPYDDEEESEDEDAFKSIEPVGFRPFSLFFR